MKTRTDEEAERDKRRKKLLRGWRDGFINDAFEGQGQSSGNDYICCNIVFSDGDIDRETKVYLTDTTRGRDLLRKACQAVNALAKFEAGEISATDFIGHHIRAKLDIEKRRGYPDRNVIVDMAARASNVVTPLRTAG